MPVQPSVRVCTHIKVTGVRCGSPALRGEQFCYFHQRMHRGVRTPPQARLHPIALIEDEESIQTALMEVINALMRNTIDLKRAALILRALHIAVKNASRVKINANSRSMVTEIPDYTEQPIDEATAAQQAELDIPESIVPPESRPRRIHLPMTREELIAQHYGTQSPPAAHVTADGKAHVPGNSTGHVGTGAARPEPSRRVRAEAQPSAATTTAVHLGTPAPGYAGGPGVSGRTSTAASGPNRNATNGKGTSSTRAVRNPQTVPASAAAGHRAILAANVTKKKPPLPVKHTPAPKERKIAAQRASAG